MISLILHKIAPSYAVNYIGAAKVEITNFEFEGEIYQTSFATLVDDQLILRCHKFHPWSGIFGEPDLQIVYKVSVNIELVAKRRAAPKNV